MSDFEHVVSAIGVLAPPGYSIDHEEDEIPAVPGLYALFIDLGPGARALELHGDDAIGPLYVGKAEKSLASRDVKTHFATGQTGSSTVRRSFAALLREPLELRAIPRNPLNPERFANFALEPDSDQRLTRWMLRHLTLKTWKKPHGVELRTIEVGVLRALQPPLNLTDVERPWPRLKAARKVMAAEAKAWALGKPTA